jgi:hypothetical protein
LSKKTIESTAISSKTQRETQKQLVEELKIEWKSMWTQRYNDKVIAEGISVTNYERLRVNRGTVIHATRNFKALNFKDILIEHLIENPEKYNEPNVREGGWNKFIKTNITKCSSRTKRTANYTPVKSSSKQSKKSGRGWLHKN